MNKIVFYSSEYVECSEFIEQAFTDNRIDPTCEHNQSLILFDRVNQKVIGAISFHSDSGTNYHRHCTVDHEILYLNDNSWIDATGEDLNLCYQAISQFILQYLISSFHKAPPQLTGQITERHFQYGAYVVTDRDAILQNSINLICPDMFKSLLTAFGYTQ